jgi:tRNA uridine 5-carboxymethylaminomethyl modification enzyme
VLRTRGESPVILARDEAYIGVMIDDLVTRGIGGEPYRMFTSRAEYRLLLREDNADRRLSPIGERLGLIGAAAGERIRRRTERVAAEIERLRVAIVAASDENNRTLVECGSAPIREATRALDLLRRPQVAYADVIRMAALAPDVDIDQAAELETEVKYEGYVRRQSEAVERGRRMEQTTIPDWVDFRAVPGLSTEARERLASVRPRSLGQAARMPGITPAAVSLLAVHIRAGRGSVGISG